MDLTKVAAGEFTTTGIVIIIITLGLIGYDVYLYVKKKPTLSGVLTRWSFYSPVLPFIAGMLCGHWFW